MFDINNISGTVSLPTGASTEGTQVQVLQAVQGLNPGGTVVTGGTFNTTPPTLTNGQTSSFQLDSSGRLIISPLSAMSSVNVAQFGGTNVSLGQTVMASSMPTTIASDQSPLPVTQSGSWSVTAMQATGTNLHTTVDNFPASFGVTQVTSPWVVSGTVTSNQGTSPWVVSGTVTANQGTNPWLARATDGTNPITKTFDLDTSGITHEWNSGASIRLPASGGSVAGGTASNPLRIDPTGTTTQPVSGTVTANQGGTWTVQAAQSGSWAVTANAGTNLNTSALALDTSVNGLQVSQGSSTTGQKGPLTQAAVTTSSPSYTTGQTSPLSLTLAGALRTDSSATVQPVSGTITATNSANGNTGSAVPAQATQVGGSDGTNLRALKVSSTGVLSVDGSAVTQPISGTVTANQGGTWTVQQGSPPWSVSQSGSWTVTANAGTNLNTSLLALDTSVNGILRTQGSTTSGQSGPLIQGAVTTAAPSYTTGQTSPLSLTLTGALRTDASGTTQPISGTVTANQGGAPWSVSQSGTWTVQPGNTANTTPWLVTVATALPTGANTIGAVTQASGPWTQNLTQVGGSAITLGQKTSPSSIPVVIASDQSGINRFLDTQASGNITTVNGSLGVPSNGASEVSVNVTGTWTATLGFEATNDNVNYNFTVTCSAVPGGALNTNTTTTGTWRCPVGGFTFFRVRATSFTSGTASVTLNSSSGSSLARIYQNNAASLLTSAWTFDGSGNAITSTGGSLNANVTNTIPVSQSGSWTVTANQGGTWTVQPGNTANTTPWLVTVSTALPTGSNTIGAVTQASGPWTNNVTQFGGTNISTGTGAGGAGIPRVTISNDSSLAANQSVNVAQMNGVATTMGNGVSGTGVQRVTIASDSTGQTTVTGSLPTGSNVIGGVTQSGTWTVQQGTPPWTVTGNNASGATDTGNPVKIGGVFNTTLPTLTTGQRGDLQMDNHARPLVVDTAAEASLAQIVTNTATANSDTLVTGNITAVCTDANINACGAGSTVSIGAFGIYTVTGSITGTWVATLVVDGQYADNTWGKIGALLDGTVYAQANQLTGNAKLVVQSGGYQNIRVRANAFTSGTVAVGLEASIAQKSVVAITIPNTWTFAHLTGAATTTLKTGPGVLHAVNINNGNSGQTSVFNNTSGAAPTIAVLSNAAQTPFPFDIQFTTGLTVTTTNSTTDITVMYQWIFLIFILPRRRYKWLSACA